jgi:hypothetical protein
VLVIYLASVHDVVSPDVAKVSAFHGYVRKKMLRFFFGKTLRPFIDCLDFGFDSFNHVVPILAFERDAQFLGNRAETSFGNPH